VPTSNSSRTQTETDSVNRVSPVLIPRAVHVGRNSKINWFGGSAVDGGVSQDTQGFYIRRPGPDGQVDLRRVQRYAPLSVAHLVVAARRRVRPGERETRRCCV